MVLSLSADRLRRRKHPVVTEDIKCQLVTGRSPSVYGAITTAVPGEATHLWLQSNPHGLIKAQHYALIIDHRTGELSLLYLVHMGTTNFSNRACQRIQSIVTEYNNIVEYLPDDAKCTEWFKDYVGMYMERTIWACLCKTAETPEDIHNEVGNDLLERMVLSFSDEHLEMARPFENLSEANQEVVKFLHHMVVVDYGRNCKLLSTLPT